MFIEMLGSYDSLLAIVYGISFTMVKIFQLFLLILTHLIYSYTEYTIYSLLSLFCFLFDISLLNSVKNLYFITSKYL